MEPVDDDATSFGEQDMSGPGMGVGMGVGVGVGVGTLAVAPRMPAASRATAAERSLLELVQRKARQPEGWLVLVVRLSQLDNPQAHHRRIAMAMMQETAQRHDGQVFALRNADLVLLCREAAPLPAGRIRLPPRDLSARDIPASALPASDASSAASPDPATLPRTLARLLRLELTDPNGTIVVWRLAEVPDQVILYAAAREAEDGAAPVPDEEPADQPAMMDAIAALVDTAAIADLMQRQTAVALLLHDPPEGSAGAAHPHRPQRGHSLRPLYREVTFSIAALQARIATGANGPSIGPGGGPVIGPDPFLFHHLAARLDQRMLRVMTEDVERLGPAAAAALPPFHINLTLAGILSPGFARLAQACQPGRIAAGVEISLVEACADPDRFAHAREIVAQAGMLTVLDGVSHSAMVLACPWTLQPDLLKLDWSARIPALDPHDHAALAEAVAALGPQRIVLHRAETEAALHWGLAQGIRRFQGRHVDAMLAASRILACPGSARCTVRQCAERASATGPAGRVGCGNQALLDAGAPISARAPAENRMAESRGAESRMAESRGANQMPRSAPPLNAEHAA